MKTFTPDIETTGLPNSTLELDAVDQPYAVEVAGLLHSDGDLASQFSLIIRPDGWVISEAMTKKHGISQELALAVGVGEAIFGSFCAGYFEKAS